MRESQIERALVSAVKSLGGECRKVKWVGRKGAPDRLVMLPGCSFWVELKTPGEKAKPHQVREHGRMEAMGQRVEVVDSIDRIREMLF